MSTFDTFVLTYVLNSLWQIPLILAAAWIAARLARPIGPATEHRVWVSALLTEALLPAISLLPWERLNLAWHFIATQAETGSVAVQFGAGTASAGWRLPAFLFTTLTVLYAIVTLYLGARFAWRWIRLGSLARTATPLALTGDQRSAWNRWLTHFGKDSVQFFSSGEIFAPLTIGFIHRCVMLPDGMAADLTPADLDTVISHELAHVQRMDFLKNLLYELMTLPASYHPALWFTRQRVTETREMVCDEMAAHAFGKRAYAESLLSLARVLLEGRSPQVPYAIGVFDSGTLERRLMKLTEMKKRIGRMRLYASLAACVAIGVATATSALALRIGMDQKSADNAALSKGTPTNVPAKQMQQQLITKIPPVYPPEAKKARIQGKVVLEAVIGKEGHVENLKVVSGPKELQQSALDAVRQWVYKPYLANGAPVEVTTTINVIYWLQK